MQAASLPLLSHGKYADGTTDGLTPDRDITLSTILSQRNKRLSCCRGTARRAIPSKIISY